MYFQPMLLGRDNLHLSRGEEYVSINQDDVFCNIKNEALLLDLMVKIDSPFQN